MAVSPIALIYRINNFIQAIEKNDLETVRVELAKGIPVKLSLAGSPPVDCTEETPYLRAKSRGFEEMTELLKEQDDGFSEEMIQKRLDCYRFDINPSFRIQGITFTSNRGNRERGGLGHWAHHEYLIPDIIDSFRAYSGKNASFKSETILKALEKKYCTYCATSEQKKEMIAAIKNRELVIISDTSFHNHRHWINILIKAPWIGEGDRGTNSWKSGIKITKTADIEINEENSFVSDLFRALSSPNQIFHSHLSCQSSPSCSRYSYETVISGSEMFIDLDDSYQINEEGIAAIKSLDQKAKQFFQDWKNFDCDRCFRRIMNAPPNSYDHNLYVRFFSAYMEKDGVSTICSEVALQFFQFLLSKGPIPWGQLDESGRTFHQRVKEASSAKFGSFAELLTRISKVIVYCDDRKKGDTLFIRGDGPGMHWKKGKPMVHFGQTSLFLDGQPFNPFRYTILLNDKQNESIDRIYHADGEHPAMIVVSFPSF
jgi:hypothetical protein